MKKRESFGHLAVYPAAVAILIAISVHHVGTHNAYAEEIDAPISSFGKTAANALPLPAVPSFASIRRDIEIAAAQNAPTAYVSVEKFKRFSLAIVHKESTFDPNAQGDGGKAWGLGQVHCGYVKGKPMTAQVLGYSGPCWGLLEPSTAAYWTTIHLAKAVEAARGDLCKAASLHHDGLHAKPRCTPYGRKVMAYFAKL